MQFVESMQSGILDIRRLGSHAEFSSVRNLYNSQDKVTKVLAHRLVDGGSQKMRARKSFANEKGSQTQYLVEWADTVVAKEHLPILEANGYRAQNTREFTQYGYGLAAFMVEVSWHPTWEPEARLCNHAPHLSMVQEYKRENLECSPARLQARNIDSNQGVRLQQGLDACAVPCNAYDLGLKTHLHISLDPINPDLDISPPGCAVIQM